MSRRKELEEIAQQIGGAILEEMNDRSSGRPIGFMFMAFDFGPGAFTAYVSNARRADMIRVLREQADRLEAGLDHTAGEA